MSDRPLWTPSPERIAATHLARFAAFAGGEAAAALGQGASSVDYDALHRWSIDAPADFWSALWRYCGVVAPDRGGGQWQVVVQGFERMAPPDPALGPVWFTGARLNFAENLLRYRDDREALVSWGEQGRRTSLTYTQLHD
jgi:acetoacetyl-CoA synthetase